MWWGPTKAFCRSVNVHGVVVLFAGGGDTSTLHVITEHFELFAPRGGGDWKISSNCMGALTNLGARPCALTGLGTRAVGAWGLAPWPPWVQGLAPWAQGQLECEALHPDHPGCEALCSDCPWHEALCPDCSGHEALHPDHPGCEGSQDARPCTWPPWVQGLAPWLPWAWEQSGCLGHKALTALGVRSCVLTALGVRPCTLTVLGMRAVRVVGAWGLVPWQSRGQSGQLGHQALRPDHPGCKALCPDCPWHEDGWGVRPCAQGGQGASSRPAFEPNEPPGETA